MLGLGARGDVLALGDEVARSLGLGVERTRMLLLATAVVLTGVAVSSAGPIGFVAFISPHIARRLARPARVGDLLLTSAACGAVLVLVADLSGGCCSRRPRSRSGSSRPIIAAPYFLAPAPREPDRGGRMSDAPLRAAGLTVGYDDARRGRAASTWRSRASASPPSSAPTAAASRRCCARSRACIRPRAGHRAARRAGDPRAAHPRGRAAARDAARSRPSRPTG